MTSSPPETAQRIDLVWCLLRTPPPQQRERAFTFKREHKQRMNDCWFDDASSPINWRTKNARDGGVLVGGYEVSVCCSRRQTSNVSLTQFYKALMILFSRIFHHHSSWTEFGSRMGASIWKRWFFNCVGRLEEPLFWSSWNKKISSWAKKLWYLNHFKNLIDLSTAQI